MRTTPTKLRQQIARLQRKGLDVAIGWAYGQPRVTNNSESRDVSPRLATGQMALWLDGFESGADMSDATIGESDAAFALFVRRMCSNSSTKHNPYGIPAVTSAIVYLHKRVNETGDLYDAAETVIYKFLADRGITIRPVDCGEDGTLYQPVREDSKPFDCFLTRIMAAEFALGLLGVN